MLPRGLSRAAGQRGNSIILNGTNFGDVPNKVIVNAGTSTEASVFGWTNSTIMFKLPTLPSTPGTIQIIVWTAAGPSTPLNYTAGACTTPATTTTTATTP